MAIDPASMAFTAIAKVTVEKALGGATRAWTWFRKNLELPKERQEILADLLLVEGQYLLHPASDYRPALGQPPAPIGDFGYPHDFEALRAFLSLVPGVPVFSSDAVFTVQAAPSDHLIAAGSPKANALSRLYLPSYSISREGKVRDFETILHPDDVPYSFVENLVQPKVGVISKMRGSVPDMKTRKAILHSRLGTPAELWQPRGYLGTKMLARDFLLISRLPRNESGASIVIAGGGHGAGTEAVRLAFQELHISELHSLHSSLKDKPYWQFVIEVTRVEHRTDGSTPTKVRLCEKLPPVEVKPRLKAQQ